MQFRVVSAYCKGGGVDLPEGAILTVGVDITESEARVKMQQGFVVPVLEEDLPEADERVLDRDPKASRIRRRG